MGIITDRVHSCRASFRIVMKVLISGTDTSVLGKGVCIRTPIHGRLSKLMIWDHWCCIPVLTLWRPSTDTSVLGKGTRPSTDTSVLRKGMRPSTDTSVSGKGVSVQTILIIDRLDTGDVLRGVSGFL